MAHLDARSKVMCQNGTATDVAVCTKGCGGLSPAICRMSRLVYIRKSQFDKGRRACHRRWSYYALLQVAKRRPEQLVYVMPESVKQLVHVGERGIIYALVWSVPC